MPSSPTGASRNKYLRRIKRSVRTDPRYQFQRCHSGIRRRKAASVFSVPFATESHGGAFKLARIIQQFDPGGGGQDFPPPAPSILRNGSKLHRAAAARRGRSNKNIPRRRQPRGGGRRQREGGRDRVIKGNYNKVGPLRSPVSHRWPVDEAFAAAEDGRGMEEGRRKG